MHTLQINFIDERQELELDIPEQLIEKVLTEAYAGRAETDGSVNIMFLNDEDMAQMNETYLNHAGPTDVLAFDDGDIEDNCLMLGDIAVSVDTALRVSLEKDMTYSSELTLYTLHGLLHLLGMDDKTPEDREAMEAAQEEEFHKHNLIFNK